MRSWRRPAWRCPASTACSAARRRATTSRRRRTPGFGAAADLVRTLCQSRDGLVLEHKDQSIALHYRRAPEAEAAVVEFVERLGRTEALAVQHGHKVIELRSPGPDKGAAVRAFLGRLTSGARRPSTSATT